MPSSQPPMAEQITVDGQIQSGFGKALVCCFNYLPKSLLSLQAPQCPNGRWHTRQPCHLLQSGLGDWLLARTSRALYRGSSKPSFTSCCQSVQCSFLRLLQVLSAVLKLAKPQRSLFCWACCSWRSAGAAHGGP